MTNLPLPQPQSSSMTKDPRRWWSLIAICSGLLMTLLDVTVVNVALPTIGESLGARLSSLQWIVNAYTLPLAVFIVTGGRLGDIFGRKRFFVIGLAIFTIGSLLCGLAGSVRVGGVSAESLLIAARALQGVGGSIMLPLAMAIIAATFAGKERGIAYGVYGGVSALGTAIGPVVGGLLVERVGWQSIFYLNVPIGIVASAVCAWAVSESRDSSAPRRIDLPGLVTLTASLGALFLALIQGNDSGWGSMRIIACFATASAFMAIFTLVELRQRHPMVDIRVFRSGSFTGTCIVGFSLGAGLYALLFFIVLYVQNYLGFSALGAGLRLLTLSTPVMLFAPAAGALAGRLGAKNVLSIGMLVLTASLALMLRVSPRVDPADWVLLAPALVGSGIAIGLVNPPMASVAIESVPGEQSGMAAGVNNLFRQLGTGFGIALLGALLSSTYDALLARRISALAIPGLSATQQGLVRSRIADGLKEAGTFVASTGLRTVPQRFAPWAAMPFFGRIQEAVRDSFMGGLRVAFMAAVGIAAAGLLAALFLVKRKPCGRGSRSAGH
jgi:EmrB/QacA subfamily drug resistance transporter